MRWGETERASACEREIGGRERERGRKRGMKKKRRRAASATWNSAQQQFCGLIKGKRMRRRTRRRQRKVFSRAMRSKTDELLKTMFLCSIGSWTMRFCF